MNENEPDQQQEHDERNPNEQELLGGEQMLGERTPTTSSSTSSEQPADESLTPEESEAEPRAAPPRIYVASLSDYNAGILHGKWIDTNENPEIMQDEINSMLASSPTTAAHGDKAEEWAIHDHEGFGKLRLSEWEPLSHIATLAAGIQEHGPAFAAWADQVGSGPEELERFSECYLGEWDSVEDFAESMLDDSGIVSEIEKMVPEHVRAYIKVDVEALARDLQYGGDITAVDRPGGGVWVFGS